MRADQKRAPRLASGVSQDLYSALGKGSRPKRHRRPPRPRVPRLWGQGCRRPSLWLGCSTQTESSSRSSRCAPRMVRQPRQPSLHGDPDGIRDTPPLPLSARERGSRCSRSRACFGRGPGLASDGVRASAMPGGSERERSSVGALGSPRSGSASIMAPSRVDLQASSAQRI